MSTESETHISLIDRMTPEVRVSAKKIEQLQIEDYKKVELALLLIGVVQATEVSIFDWNDNIETVKQTLEQCGMTVVISEEKPKGGPSHLEGVLYVGRDSDTVDTFRTLSPAADHEAYGHMMGYPKTAVAAFGNENEMVMDEVLVSEATRIRPFRLSQDGAADELQTIQEWEAYIQESMPTVYEELMQSTQL